MPDFLHGVETFRLLAGPRPITEVRSAVIGLVGVAPVHHAIDGAAPNELYQVLSDRDWPKFGPDGIAGYDIPAALRAIGDAGAGTVIVVNVFDPAIHREAIAEVSRTITAGKITLPTGDIISAVVKTTTPTTCVEGTDYTIDRITGVITVIEGGALDGDASALVAHVRADLTEVTAADIIGTVTVAGERTGAQRFLNAMSQLGFGPKILIAPGYSSDATVVAALDVLAQATKLRAIAITDVPVGTLRDEAIEGRGVDGDLNLRSASQRVLYAYPHVKAADPATGGERLLPLSPRAAGTIAHTDRDVGYWRSPSNRQILGITGMELPLTAGVNDPTSDVNALNAVGIVTIFAAFGTGYRLWGNRNASFPGATDVLTFTSVLRTCDVVDESVELFTLTHLDGPITDVLITAVLQDVNAFIRQLVQRGALMPGSRVEWFPEDNAPVDIAAGKLTFTKTYLPPIPAERITYKSVIDTNLLAGLGG